MFDYITGHCILAKLTHKISIIGSKAITLKKKKKKKKKLEASLCNKKAIGVCIQAELFKSQVLITAMPSIFSFVK